MTRLNHPKPMGILELTRHDDPWPWPTLGEQWRQWLSKWRNVVEWRWPSFNLVLVIDIKSNKNKPYGTNGAMSCLGWTCDHRGTCCQRRRRQSVKYHHRGHVEYGRRRDRYPMTRLKSAHRQWRRRRMVDGCSCSSQCELEWQRQGGWGPWKRLASCRWHLNL